MNPPKTAYISLGSNLGNRFGFLQQALNEIHKNIGEIVAVSRVFETPSWGFQGNAFLNACAAVSSRFSAVEVLQKLLEIESILGRQRSDDKIYHNRSIDLDIILWESEIISSESLQIPHPHMQKRKFVLQPLGEIASEVRHPKIGRNISEILQCCSDTSEVHPLTEKLDIPRIFFENSYNYIAVEGNIGAGKTSFARMISQDFNAKLILERFKDNPFLPKFYQEKSRYAFPLEMSFLADRYQQLSDDIAQYDLFKDFVVSDYDVFKSLIFAKITLAEDEYSLYHKLFNIMYRELVKPDLYIYLYQNTDRLLVNIKKRGREYEQNIQQEYLSQINQSYLSFIKSQPDLNVKIIDISGLDFVNQRADYLRVLKEIWPD